MSSEKKKRSKVKAENKTKKKINTKKVAIVTGVSILAVIIALLITVYALFHYFYNKMTIETADTGTQDLRELAAILREDLDADVSGFPQKDVDAARSAIVLEKIELLPKLLNVQLLMLPEYHHGNILCIGKVKFVKVRTILLDYFLGTGIQRKTQLVFQLKGIIFLQLCHLILYNVSTL